MTRHRQQFLSLRILHEVGLLEREGTPTYEQFLKEWMPRNLLNVFASQAGGYDAPDFVATLQSFYVALIIAQNNDVVFALSSDLIHALRDTEIPDVPTEEVRLPFDGINIDFPRGTLESPAHEISRLMMSLVEGDRFRIACHNDDVTNYVNFIPEPGKTLFQCTSEAAQRQLWTEMKNPELVQAYRDSAMYKDYWETDMFRLAINTMLYITSPDADVVEDKSHVHKLHTRLQGVKKGRKQELLVQQLNQARKEKRYIVGAKFRLQREYNTPLTDEGKKWVLKHRVRVMGHWKNQPYGPNKELRRRQWISPYWKGMTYDKMIEKGYAVR
jgi:hypothetical protein